jgi:hypothetical protein
MSSLDPTQIIMVGASGDQLDNTSSMDNSGDSSNIWESQS